MTTLLCVPPGSAEFVAGSRVTGVVTSATLASGVLVELGGGRGVAGASWGRVCMTHIADRYVDRPAAALRHGQLVPCTVLRRAGADADGSADAGAGGHWELSMRRSRIDRWGLVGRRDAGKTGIAVIVMSGYEKFTKNVSDVKNIFTLRSIRCSYYFYEIKVKHLLAA